MIGVVSTCNEGMRIENCIIQLKKITNKIYILNDGIFDTNTKIVIDKYNLLGIEFS